MISHLRSRLDSEDGFVVPVAIGVIALTFLFAGVAVSQTSVLSGQTDDDRRVKRALQAADAGLELAEYRMNSLDVTRAGVDQKCVVANETSGDLEFSDYDADGWCPEVTGELADGATFSYRAGPEPEADAQGHIDRTVVATGSVAGVNRRVAAALGADVARPLFPGEMAVFSDASMTLNSNSVVGGNAGSNGDINLDSNARICGNATPGPGGSVNRTSNGSVCPGFSTAPASELKTFPDVMDTPSPNDNGRICVNDACTETSSVSWNSSRRRLSLNGNATVTLGGSNYSFCYLSLDSNAQLIIPPRPADSPVRIFIDSPENCNATSPPSAPSGSTAPNGLGSVVFNSNARIVNQNADASSLQLYLRGSTSTPPRETSVEFDSNTDTTQVIMTIYAPKSEVHFDSNTQYLGAIAAKEVSFNSNTTVTWDDAASAVTAEGVDTFLNDSIYRECSSAPAPGQMPDNGC